MVRRFAALWVVFLLAAVLGLAGCPPSKPKKPASQNLKPGEPVSFKTNYYLIVNGQRQYYATEEDLKLAISRLQPGQPPGPR